MRHNGINMSYRFALPTTLAGAVEKAAADWNANNKVARFWQKDASLWTSDGEEKWLGWTTIVEREVAEVGCLKAVAADVKKSGFESVVLLGMGGSSLCPEVLSLTFGQQAGFPKLYIVDSTDPEQVKSIRDSVNLAKSLVIVASKSGSTLEPNILKQYFFDEMVKAVGADAAGSHFLAITDPGSKMQQVATDDKFRTILLGDPQIGGRFSALSNFGLTAAATMGLDLDKVLAAATSAVTDAKKAVAENSAVQLGLLMGEANLAGRDKLTIYTSEEIFDLGAWMEQLIAESTGKLGKGITPVDREAIADPSVYGSDRLFVHIRYTGTKNPAHDEKIAKGLAALEAAGHPVVSIELNDLYQIFGQFLTWEVATSVAGSIMGINPFNQPDVESAKIETRALTSAYEETGKLPESSPILSDAGVSLYATEAYAATLKAAAPEATLVGYIKAHLDQIKAGDYFAALAYLPMFQQHEDAIQGFRHAVLAKKHVATCLGFGPRFLHSTGQDYKGGPNSGVFVTITAEHGKDLAIPGSRMSFGVVIDAQAGGDLAVLQARDRRALRLHLGADIAAGLKTVAAAFEKALA